MSCTKHFLNFQWEHHSWRRRVSSSEIVRGQETNMWARVMDRDYMRCDKQDVCEVCGKVRREVSCICDMERGERCKLRRASLAESREATA
jgi:hypothetical protein